MLLLLLLLLRFSCLIEKLISKYFKWYSRYKLAVLDINQQNKQNTEKIIKQQNERGLEGGTINEQTGRGKGGERDIKLFLFLSYNAF